MKSHMLVLNVGELLKNYLHFKTTKESIVGNGHLLAKLAAKVFGNEFRILFTGKS